MDGNENERLVLFSDAVIAITITLLVLELRLSGPAGEMSNDQLWAALVSVVPNLLAYILSFIVIGLFWTVHRTSFARIQRSDPWLIWLNIGFLMAIGLMPFVTAILAENGGTVGTAIYAGLLAIVSILLGSIGVYARFAGLADKTEQRGANWAAYLDALIFAASIGVAFYNADLAKYMWLLLIPAGIWGRRTGRQRSA